MPQSLLLKNSAKGPLLSLPNDLLMLVLSRLGTRALLRVGATCHALHDAVAGMPLRPVLTSKADIVCTNILDWLTSHSVAPRVVSLTARCCAWGNGSFTAHLRSLKTLVITFGVVRNTLLQWLPKTLEHLDIHRVRTHGVGVFSTSQFAHLTNLRVLKVTFTRSFHTVVIGEGLHEIPLRHLSLRGRQTFISSHHYTPLQIDTVHLECYRLAGRLAPVHAANLTMLSETAIDKLEHAITPASAGYLKALHVKCSNVGGVPCTQHMTGLRHLHLNLVSVKLDLACLPSLHSMVLETQCGAALSNLAMLPPRAEIFVAGAPVRIVPASNYTLGAHTRR